MKKMTAVISKAPPLLFNIVSYPGCCGHQYRQAEQVVAAFSNHFAAFGHMTSQVILSWLEHGNGFHWYCLK